jgi:cellulose synthase/poly-beta-1,6-N-acetylglucosamine synthase-like glycosyltransferase
MSIAALIFWTCLFLILYTYFLYPAILFVAYTVEQFRRDVNYLARRRNRRAAAPQHADLLPVTMLVPVYNEEEHLEEKIENLAAMDYPTDKLQVIFVSDGSTDRSNEILGRLKRPGVEVIFKERAGKPSALNVAMERARNPVIVFSDGSTLFEPDALRMLVRHFSSPEVGVVCGSLRFATNSQSQQTEGVYWRYESMLRLMEARLGATLTSSGAIYAIRREAWAPLSPDTILDDLMTVVNARKRGYTVVYDCEAIALEFAPQSVKGEFARRVRIAIGSFRSLRELMHASLPAFTCFALFSHKLVRWMVPFLLVGVVLSNALLLNSHTYALLFVGQVIFYAWAAAGFLFEEHMRRVRFALVGYFLLAMNLAFLVGLYRCLTSRKDGFWQRVN